MLDTSVSGQIEDDLAMFLEGLPGEDLREQVRRIVLGANMGDGDNAGAAQLAHLKHLTVDVAGVLRRREAMAQVVGGLVVGEAFDGRLLMMADMREHGGDVDELDSALSKRVQLSLTGRHRNAVLPPRDGPYACAC